MAWQQIKSRLLIYHPHHLGTSLLAFPTLIIFYCLISRGVHGMTHNQASLLFLALSLAVGFSAPLLPYSPVSQIIAHVIPEY